MAKKTPEEIAALQKAAAEKAEAERVAAEQKAADEKAEAERVAAEQKAADEKAEAERVAAEQKAADEKAEAERIAAEQKAAADKKEVPSLFIKSVPESFCRCGRRFTREGYGIALDVLTADEIERLKAEPNLVVEEVEALLD